MCNLLTGCNIPWSRWTIFLRILGLLFFGLVCDPVRNPRAVYSLQLCAGSHVAAPGWGMVVSGMQWVVRRNRPALHPVLHACLRNIMDYKPLLNTPCNSLTIKR